MPPFTCLSTMRTAMWGASQGLPGPVGAGGSASDELDRLRAFLAFLESLVSFLAFLRALRSALSALRLWPASCQGAQPHHWRACGQPAGAADLGSKCRRTASRDQSARAPVREPQGGRVLLVEPRACPQGAGGPCQLSHLEGLVLLATGVQHQALALRGGTGAGPARLRARHRGLLQLVLADAHALLRGVQLHRGRLILRRGVARSGAGGQLAGAAWAAGHGGMDDARAMQAAAGGRGQSRKLRACVTLCVPDEHTACRPLTPGRRWTGWCTAGPGGARR